MILNKNGHGQRETVHGQSLRLHTYENCRQYHFAIFFISFNMILLAH